MGTIRSDLTRDELIEDTIKLVQGEKTGFKWRQSVWAEETACGTACCVAGNVAYAAGYVPTENTTFGGPKDDIVVRPLGRIGYHVSPLAEHLLGLTRVEAAYLFEAGRSKRAILKALRHMLAGGEVKELRGYKQYEAYHSATFSNADRTEHRTPRPWTTHARPWKRTK